MPWPCPQHASLQLPARLCSCPSSCSLSSVARSPWSTLPALRSPSSMHARPIPPALGPRPRCRCSPTAAVLLPAALAQVAAVESLCAQPCPSVRRGRFPAHVAVLFQLPGHALPSSSLVSTRREVPPALASQFLPAARTNFLCSVLIPIASSTLPVVVVCRRVVCAAALDLCSPTLVIDLTRYDVAACASCV